MRSFPPRLTRKGRVIRNLAVVSLLLVLLWTWLCFPLPTRSMNFRRLERARLIAPGEIVYQTDWNRSRIFVDQTSSGAAVVGYLSGLSTRRLDFRLYAYPLNGAVSPVPLDNLELLFLQVPAQARRGELLLTDRAGQGETERLEGEFLDNGVLRFSFPLSSRRHPLELEQLSYTLTLFRADGSLLLRQDGVTPLSGSAS